MAKEKEEVQDSISAESVFKGQVAKPHGGRGGKPVVTVKSKVNMMLPTGAVLEKGKTVELLQVDVDFLNAKHPAGYEKKFFE